MPDIIIRALEKYAQKGFEKKHIHSNRMDSKDADYEARYIKAYNLRYFPNLDMQHENVENKSAQQEDHLSRVEKYSITFGYFSENTSRV